MSETVSNGTIKADDLKTKDHSSTEKEVGVCAIVVAAGSSSRMTAGDKLLMPLKGTPVIIRTLEVFEKCPEVDAIIAVTRQDTEEWLKSEAAKAGISKLKRIVRGGTTRAESAINGVREAEGCRIVLIHDGARPLVDAELIRSVISAAEEYGAALPVVSVKDTVKAVGDDGFVKMTPDRSMLFAAQTPQGFLRSLYLKAVDAVGENAACVTDDASLFEIAGYRVKTVKGKYTNIKLTTDSDISVANAFLSGGKYD